MRQGWGGIKEEWKEWWRYIKRKVAKGEAMMGITVFF